MEPPFNLNSKSNLLTYEGFRVISGRLLALELCSEHAISIASERGQRQKIGRALKIFTRIRTPPFKNPSVTQYR